MDLLKRNGTVKIPAMLAETAVPDFLLTNPVKSIYPKRHNKICIVF